MALEGRRLRRKSNLVDGFEQAGRAMDRELEKLSQFLEEEAVPASGHRAVEARRAASRRLSLLADELENRPASSGTPRDSQ